MEKKYSKVYPVGHSLGSSMLSTMVKLYPNVTTKVVLTGYSDPLFLYANDTAFGQFVASSYGVARDISPTRFFHLNDRYMLPRNLQGIFGFYNGAFNRTIPPFDALTWDSFGIGQSKIIYPTVPEYHHKVLIVNGDQDFGCVPPGLDCSNRV